MNEAERKQLTKIIEAEEGKRWWQSDEFETHIRAQLPTELRIVSVPPSPAANFNCFVYALGLEWDPEFLGGQNPIQKEFIRYLLNQNALEVVERPSAGGLVFYETYDRTITHGGIIQADGSVLSKWMWGALFAHKLWDVPSSFGDSVFYCRPISPEKAKEKYVEYKNTGVEIKPIT